MAVLLDAAANFVTKTLAIDTRAGILTNSAVLDVFLVAILGFFTIWKPFCWLRKLLFEPMNRIKPLNSVGYVDYDGDNRDSLVRRVRENRLAGDLPPIYPNGWYPLMESHTLKVGESRPAHFCGENVAVFRDAKGTSYVVDAYCPHLGAHLGIGGKVIDSCIQCPFHGWQFDGATGKCTQIPYTDRVPEQAKIRSWPVCEINMWIFVWYDAEGRDPLWSIPEVKGLANGELTYRGRTEHFMNGHIEEVPLNGADVVHLKVVHKAFIGGGVDLRTMEESSTNFLEHRFTAKWSQNENENEKHISLVQLDHVLTVFGWPVPLTKYDFNINQIGPALVTLEFKTIVGKIVFLHCLLPVEPLVQRIVHNVYAEWTVPTFLAKLAMLSEAFQVERDLMIWNNKQYQSKPLFVKSYEDSLLIKNRRWYSQFYSENSPRLIRQPRIRYGKEKNSQAEKISDCADRTGTMEARTPLNGQAKLNDW